MKRFLTLLAAASIAFSASATVPHKAKMPNIPGYQTLLGDCHIHTIFSDATVWPDTRVAEADLEGLDFLCITDHCETGLMKMVGKGILNAEKVDRNTSYELALAAGQKRNMIIIPGCEITCGKWIFPGHFNAFFIKDANTICAAEEAAVAKVAKAGGSEQAQQEAGLLAGLKAAREQGALIQWNHPDWNRQAHNETLWLPIHEQIYKAGLMDGIEIINRFSGYNPPAHHWCVEKNLFMTSGTDAHKPMFEECDLMAGEFRPMTLVFANERSEAGIREALEARRTVIWVDDHLYGSEEFLVPLFHEILQITDITYTENKITLKVVNNSSVPMTLTKAPGAEDIVYPRLMYINAGEIETIAVNGINNTAPIGKSSIDLNFYVENFETDVDTPVKVTIHIDVPAEFVKTSDKQVEVSPAYSAVGRR